LAEFGGGFFAEAGTLGKAGLIAAKGLVTFGGNAIESGIEGKFDFNQVAADSFIDNASDLIIDKIGSKYAKKNLTDFGSEVFSFGKDVVSNPLVKGLAGALQPKDQSIANRTATVAAPKATATTAASATNPSGASGGGTTSSGGGSGSTYTVKAGDTLGNIGSKFGSTATAIGSANGIQNLNVIRPGQVLKIPGKK
jgi:LysM repeat protein